MLDANIAEKVFEKGVRKDLYEVEQDYYQTFITLFSATWSKVVSKNKMMHKKLKRDLLSVLDEELTPEAEEKVNELLKELKEWLDYYNWLSRLIEFLRAKTFLNMCRSRKKRPVITRRFFLCSTSKVFLLFLFNRA